METNLVIVPQLQAPGFQLRRLLLLGTHAPPAELTFRIGLNVIAGPSDTGKSFAFECIDFMFGAKDRPRALNVAKAYDRAVLEVEETFTGRHFTAERPFSQGKVRWYSVAFAEINKDTPFELLASVHSADNVDTLSYRLLTLSGLAGRALKKNQRGETRTVSIRNVARLVLVDEERAITRQSPILGSQKTDETADRSLFRLMLTGTDDSGLAAIEDKVASRRTLEAQADILDTLLGEERSGDEDVGALVEVSQQLSKLQTHVDQLTGDLNATSERVQAVAGERDATFATLQSGKSRLLVVTELLQRFELLKMSYSNDLKRLEFIAEGKHYFGQLETVSCPICHRQFDGTSHDSHGLGHSGDQSDSIELEAACLREAEKIRLQSSDLTASVSDLADERQSLLGTIADVSLQVQQLDDHLERNLKPNVGLLTRDLRAAFTMREQVVQQEAALHQRATIVEARLGVARRLEGLVVALESVQKASGFSYVGFAEQVREIIQSWGYGGADAIAFDPKAMDIVVEGEARGSHGKGVRAIMLAAFVLGLLRYCRSHRLPHPGFVVFDSPLTTYRPTDDATSANEDVPVDMQRAFFETLAQSTLQRGEQVIVFENKEPPATTMSAITYTHFTGLLETGRKGFIPS